MPMSGDGLSNAHRIWMLAVDNTVEHLYQLVNFRCTKMKRVFALTACGMWQRGSQLEASVARDGDNCS